MCFSCFVVSVSTFIASNESCTVAGTVDRLLLCDFGYEVPFCKIHVMHFEDH